MKHISKHTGRTVTINGREYVNYSTTSYLNLGFEEAFQSLVIEGIKQYGHSYGSSPLTQPQLSIYEELESLFADYYNVESALLFSTGFAASQAVMNYYVSQGFGVDYGEVHHPALHVSCKQKTEAVFATDIADPINCKILDRATLPTNQPIVVDASHGFGILDDYVRELAANAVVCGSLNKAFATPAGIVLCSKEIKEELQKQANYATSSAPSPAACSALLQAFQTGLIKKQQDKLSKLLSLIPQSEHNQFTPPLPVLKLSDSHESIYWLFLANGMLIWHNEYPKHSSKTVSRAVIHAGLTTEDVEKLLFYLECLEA